MSSIPSFIEAEQLVKRYGEKDTGVTAVDRVTLSIEEGAFVALMGESGSGKSTLLTILGAMNVPTSGSLVVDGIDVYALSTGQRAGFRREYLGFIFQSFHLVPYLTVLENVTLPLSTVKIPKSEKREMAETALLSVGLSMDKARRLPDRISGGEQERAAIARAVVNNPPVLLADEPTGNLDTKNAARVMDLLERINARGATIIMVTHSDACAERAGRVIRIVDGRLAENSPAARAVA